MIRTSIDLLAGPERNSGLGDLAREVGKRAVLGGCVVDLMTFDDAMAAIESRIVDCAAPPLGVVSANLDHIQHFGRGGRWEGTLDVGTEVEWLTLLDGAPLRTQACRLTGVNWPRLAGSDLMNPLLERATARGFRIGFLGGSAETQFRLKEVISANRPDLTVAGWWAPERNELSDPDAAIQLARDVAAARVDILVVGLGKPRQELWISHYGRYTGAKVLLAFGAVVDFLAGRVRRAPTWISRNGLEWGWRLCLEPSRLAHRYLVDGPEAYVRLRRASQSDCALRTGVYTGVPPSRLNVEKSFDVPNVQDCGFIPSPPSSGTLKAHFAGTFVAGSEPADVAIVVVTYNNADDIGPLMRSLRRETAGQSLKVIVADNSSTDGTLDELAKHPDVITVSTGGNLGYAGGINNALKHAGVFGSLLVLNPDLRVEAGAIRNLRTRMDVTGAGITVPLLLDEDGARYPSLRREPSMWRSFGDAAFGSRLPRRPGWLSEIDYDAESYAHPHRVDWATGAALLISAQAASRIGDWDERFFLYSEETDFFRRARDLGESIWFEPVARMRHRRGGSGASPELIALMAVNRIRYAEKHHPPGKTAGVRAGVMAGELIRSLHPDHRLAVRAVFMRRRWIQLPQAVRGEAIGKGSPTGSVIIPAHNEASVIGRTLDALKGLAGAKDLDIIVACNGCTDETVKIALTYDGVNVLDIPAPSKTAALNAADGVATRWPRLYLDADIEICPTAVRHVLERLGGGSLLAARPSFCYDTAGASRIVRSYYRARMRIPAMGQALWGAGVYGLSQKGHERLGLFPPVTADDYFVDRLFSPSEKAVLDTVPVTVRTPRTAGDLLAILRRVYRGNAEQRPAQRLPSGTGLLTLLGTVRSPLSAIDAVVYTVFALAGRRASRSSAGWERDESSRAGT